MATVQRPCAGYGNTIPTMSVRLATAAAALHAITKQDFSKPSRAAMLSPRACRLLQQQEADTEAPLACAGHDGREDHAEVRAQNPPVLGSDAVCCADELACTQPWKLLLAQRAMCCKRAALGCGSPWQCVALARVAPTTADMADGLVTLQQARQQPSSSR
jgi:hypothetical protein